MGARESFYARRSLMRELMATSRLECGTAQRLSFLAAIEKCVGLDGLREVCATNSTLYPAPWTAGMIPRRIAGYDGDNFKRALLDRRLQRLCTQKAYQPGPARGMLP
jgi:hypothetical protein